MSAALKPGAIRLGLRANLGQFALLVGINALVGGMIGHEQSCRCLPATSSGSTASRRR
jgi:hypothetical protein